MKILLCYTNPTFIESNLMPLAEAPYFVEANGDKHLAYIIGKYENRDSYLWEPNVPFEATIKIVSLTDTGVMMQDVDTRIYYNLFLSHLFELIELDVIRQSKIEGTWVVYRKGTRFALKRM